LELISNAAKVFTTTLAIAVGLAVGIEIMRFVRREQAAEV
jgi:hypothetical protein